MKILYVGDMYSSNSITYLKKLLPMLKEKYNYNLLMVNGENITHGRGLSKKHYKELMELNVSVISMGNHTFGQKEILDYIDEVNNLCRPANYNAPGKGYVTINYNGKNITVINLLGRVYFEMSLDNPFKVAKEIIQNVPSDYYIIDFHAEATSEKIALGYYLDGIAHAVIGTHTHVQTSDERVLPNKTLYISDIGMTGPLEGVIGVDRNVIISRFVNGFSEPNKVATGKMQFNAVLLDFTILDKPKITRIHIEE